MSRFEPGLLSLVSKGSFIWTPGTRPQCQQLQTKTIPSSNSEGRGLIRCVCLLSEASFVWSLTWGHVYLKRADALSLSDKENAPVFRLKISMSSLNPRDLVVVLCLHDVTRLPCGCVSARDLYDRDLERLTLRVSPIMLFMCLPCVLMCTSAISTDNKVHVNIII